MPIIYNSNVFGQPPQALPSKEKDERWKRYNMDWAEQYMMKELEHKRKRLIKNYNIAQGVIDIEDYIDIDVNDYQSLYNTVEGQTSESLMQENEVVAADIKFFPVVPSIINVLSGELITKFDHTAVKAIDERSVNENMEYKKGLIVQYMTQKVQTSIQSRLAEMGLEPESEEYQQQAQQMYEQEMSLPNIQKFMNRYYKSNYEEWANRILEQAQYKYRLQELGFEIFKHQLIVDEAYIHVDMLDNDIRVESWNPIETVVLKNKNTKYTTNADFVGRQYYGSIGDVVSKFRDKIDKVLLEKYNNPLGIVPSFTEYPLSPGDNQSKSLPEKRLLYFKYLMGGREFSSSSQVLITECYWISFRRMVKLKAKYSGESIVKILDDHFERTIKPEYNQDGELINGEEIEYFYIPQVWKGTKLNFSYNSVPTGSLDDDARLNKEIFGNKDKDKSEEKWKKEDIENGALYIDVQPLEYQYTDELEIYNPKIPVIGCDGFEQSMNVGKLSLVDKTKSYQVMFNAALNQIDNFMKTEIGLFYIMDQKLIPKKSIDGTWGSNNWMKFLLTAKETQLGIVDNSSEQTQGGQVFQQPNVINLLKNDQFKSRLELAQQFKILLFETIGITPQRLGTVQASESASGVQQAVNNSYAQTEVYYMNHTNLLKEFKTILLDAEKYMESKKPVSRVSFLNSDQENILFELDTDQLLIRRYNIYVTSNPDSKRVLEQLRQLALENNTSGATILDLATIIESSNTRDIKDTLRASVQNLQKQQEAERLARQQEQERALQAAAEEKDKQRAFEAEQKERDRIAKMYEAEVKALGFAKTGDMDGSGISDILEIEKFNLEQQKTYTGILNDREDARVKADIEDSKLRIQQQQTQQKSKEISSKERIEQLKIAKDLANQKNDLEIAKLNAKNRGSKK